MGTLETLLQAGTSQLDMGGEIQDRLQFCDDILQGLLYLSRKGLIHTQVASRHVLVKRQGTEQDGTERKGHVVHS